MMKRLLLVVMAVVASAVLMGIVGSAVSAQVPNPGLTPKPIDLPACEDLEDVDLNGDGKLDYRDFTLWVETLHELTGEECHLGGPASGCPVFMDVNDDGIVDYADLFELERYQQFCVNAPWQTIIRPGG